MLAASVIALLGPERATPQQIRATAAAGVRDLDEKRAVVVELLSQPAASQ